jgi:hypothetical protein
LDDDGWLVGWPMNIDDEDMSGGVAVVAVEVLYIYIYIIYPFFGWGQGGVGDDDSFFYSLGACWVGFPMSCFSLNPSFFLFLGADERNE